MYSINVETTPGILSWEEGKRLAEATLKAYRENHNGEYPRKVSYSFGPVNLSRPKGLRWHKYSGC